MFVGKGITFDSGGLSLKPPKSMETMKSDMGGAAAEHRRDAGHRRAAARRSGSSATCRMAENMPSGTAQRPSDVLTIYGGKTVEVLNTDAEGRLVLADALARSAADHPDVLVDVATLTGAQLVALGPRITGVMANDDALRDAVVDAAARAGEAACGRCRCPPSCARAWTPRSPTWPTWPRTGTAGCWSPGCSCASSCRRGALGPPGHRRPGVQ